MSKTEQMNTLFIFSDQHCKRMIGCYGNDIIKTPNIDNLAKNGVKFNNAYCTNPICMPSRASMTIGDYGSKYDYWDNMSPYGGEARGFGHRLVDEGCHLTTVGKLHYKDNSSQTGFPDQRNPLHAKNGIGDIFGSIRGFGTKPYMQVFESSILEARWGDAPHLKFDRRTTEIASSFLLNEAPEIKSKPWILKVGFITPHFPFVAPKKFESMYPLDSIPFPQQYNMDERPDHPIVEEIRRYMGVDYEMDEKTVRKARAVYYGMCSFLDEQIGLVLDALKKSGLDKNTRIIYATDHGEMLGEHGTWYKELFYEESVGIPLIMSGPDIAPNTIDENVSLLDIYPTLLDGSGIEPNDEDIQKPGRSLWPITKGEEELEKDRIIISEYHADALSTSSYMVRDDKYKFIYNVDFPSQLFDMIEDPYELNDLGQLKEYEDITTRMEMELRKVLDPEETFCRCKVQQFEKMKKYGGHAKILSQGPGFSYTPMPDEFN